MTNVLKSLAYRRFMRGLSVGILILDATGALSLFFATWCILCMRAGADPLTSDVNVDYPFGLLLPNAAAAGVLAFFAIRLRRGASGAARASVGEDVEEDRRMARRIRAGFGWTIAGEWLFMTAAVLTALRLRRPDLIWPGVELGISLHFAPLARIFRLRPYYYTALAGSVVAVVALVLPQAAMPTAERLLLASGGFAVVMWMTAVYLIVKAQSLAPAVSPERRAADA